MPANASVIKPETESTPIENGSSDGQTPSALLTKPTYAAGSGSKFEVNDAPAPKAQTLARTPKSRTAAQSRKPNEPVGEGLSSADAVRNGSVAADVRITPHSVFTVFVSAPERGGFFDTSRAVQDSVRDVRNRLWKNSEMPIAVVDSLDKADIVLTVVNRGVGKQAYGERTTFKRYYGGTALEDTPMVATTYWVSSVLKVGVYQKEFTGTWSQDQGGLRFTFGAWGKCSDDIARNVAAWVVTNAALINRHITKRN